MALAWEESHSDNLILWHCDLFTEYIFTQDHALPVATLAVVGLHLLEIVGVIRLAIHFETAVLILPGPASHVCAFSCTLGVKGLVTISHYL